MVQGEAELLARWRQGDENAFAQIVRRYEASLARFLGRLATSADSVSDLLQETFLRLHRTGPSRQENGRFSAWLFQVALNVARDAARRRRPVQALPSVEPLAVSASQEQAVQRREYADRLRQAVSELPLELREVLAQRHDLGMSFEAMARLLGTPASTLKSRFSTALRRLREQLRDLDDQE